MVAHRRTDIVWLTGWGMSPETWEEICARLPQANHIVPDFSPCTTAEELTRTARAAMESAEEPPVVVAWSLGGLMALMLCREVSMSHLVLVGSTARFVRGKGEAHLGWGDAVLRQMQRALASHREEVIHGFRSKLVPFPDEVSGQAREALRADTWTLPGLIAGLQLLRDMDARPYLGSIPHPVTIVHGADDEICPVGAARELHEGIPRARLHVWENAGHAPQWTRPQEFVTLLRGIIHEPEANGAGAV